MVMGSYERGTRSISMARAIEIANLFAIPLTELIEDPSKKDHRNDELIIFDLRKLRSTELAVIAPEISKLKVFVSAICARRRDWNGEVLTIRSSDLDTLTLVLEMNISQVKKMLNRSQLLLQSAKN